jgi:hypothetical protein
MGVNRQHIISSLVYRFSSCNHPFNKLTLPTGCANIRASRYDLCSFL